MEEVQQRIEFQQELSLERFHCYELFCLID